MSAREPIGLWHPPDSIRPGTAAPHLLQQRVPDALLERLLQLLHLLAEPINGLHERKLEDVSPLVLDDVTSHCTSLHQLGGTQTGACARVKGTCMPMPRARTRCFA